MKVETILTRTFFAGSLALMLSVFAQVPEAVAGGSDGDGDGEYEALCLDGDRKMCDYNVPIRYWV